MCFAPMKIHQKYLRVRFSSTVPPSRSDPGDAAAPQLRGGRRMAPGRRDPMGMSSTFKWESNLPGLVNLQIAMENGDRNSGFSYEKW